MGIKFQKKLKATITFNAKVASKMAKTEYYKAQAANMKELEYLESEKKLLGTPPWEKVTKMLAQYKRAAFSTKSQAGKILQGIYDKNKYACLNNIKPINANLLSVVSKPEVLILAYRMIKSNKGAISKVSIVTQQVYNNMTWEQKNLYLKSLTFPDKISIWHIIKISQLLRKGLYPWGTSTRLYFDKPGQPGKRRPITMPPFMDKIVQKAIELVLHSIYEPYFELRNRSFGFRPNKGCHDALAALTSRYTSGMRTAVEGDIQAAFDTVKKPKLLQILSKRIHDNKFLKLIENRLQYEVLDCITYERFTPEEGIPQGGIDAPYLFNIYLAELDDYVLITLQEEVNNLNKSNYQTRSESRAYTSIRATKRKYQRYLAKTRLHLKKLPMDPMDPKVVGAKNKLHSLVKTITHIEHTKNKISSSPINKKSLRIFYVRYADDWVLLTNGDSSIATYLKDKIATFLTNELQLTLSEGKTLITNITKAPVRFLGYELRISGKGALRRLKSIKLGSIKKATTCKKSGLLVYAQPDKVRLINRFTMKGFCDANGFPQTLPWLSCLESFCIIERFNSIIRGIANYYLPVIRNRARIHRWIYILRFACLKTLAQKYKISISKVFKKFGHNMHSKSDQTITVRVQQKFREKQIYKDWTLLTYKDAVLQSNYNARRELALKTFLDRENGAIGDYPLKTGKVPVVTNQGYLDSITWVSWRTMASVNMPCSACPNHRNKPIHMHHIKHIRKRAYKLIPEPESYQKIMALRNRKQIPLCEDCHQRLVHTGKYDGDSLKRITPVTKLMDNRIIHVESFIKPGKQYFAKSIEEKGWKPVVNKVVNKNDSLESND